MKDITQQFLIEGVMPISKNSLNIEVSRPSQVLIIMRGVAGAGKSTRARGKKVLEHMEGSQSDINETHNDFIKEINKMQGNDDLPPTTE